MDEVHDLPSTAIAKDRILVIRHRPEAIVCTTYGVSRQTGKYQAFDYDVIWNKNDKEKW
jgi:hypothetical protein